MGLHWADHSVEVNAPIEACFETITDYDGMEDWLSAVLGTEVLDTDPDTGLAELVKLDVDGKVRTINYTLRYDYDRPTRVGWDFVEGHGVKRIEGEWTFEDRGVTTLAKYRLGVDPGGGVPGPIAKRMNRQVIKRSVEDLRDEVERRAAANVDGEADAAVHHPHMEGEAPEPEPAQPHYNPGPGLHVPRTPPSRSADDTSPLDELSDAAMEAAEAGAKLIRVSAGVAMITAAGLLRRGRDLLP